MAIQIDAEKKIFTLETDHTMYQMQADAYGVLRHLWYGAKTGCDMSYLQDYPDVGFSGNIYAAGNDRTYSLDTLPLEYAGAGRRQISVCRRWLRSMQTAAAPWICAITATR